MEVADLSELCRLCLDTSHVLFPFETTLVAYTKRTIPQLIKFCLDIDCISNDDGIAPKNLCQACLDKLQICFEFRTKSQESDKYLKQIISHSTEQPEAPTLTPYNSYPDDEDSLLQPLDNYDEPVADNDAEQDVPKKGQRVGEFTCNICYKSFKYIKPLRNHMKLHKKFPKAPQKQPKGRPKGSFKAPKRQTMKQEQQPAYDSISPYASPAPYNNPTTHLETRDSSPDFGALMLSTSQMIGNEMNEEDEDAPRTTRTGRLLKRSSMADDDADYTPNGSTKRTRTRASAPAPAPVKAPALAKVQKTPARVEKTPDPPKSKPGPLSKTRGKPEKKKQEEEFAIEGFCEVDISKMLKKSKKSSTSMIEMVDDESQKSSESSASPRSRASRSPSVELIPEFDIFNRR